MCGRQAAATHTSVAEVFSMLGGGATGFNSMSNNGTTKKTSGHSSTIPENLLSLTATLEPTSQKLLSHRSSLLPPNLNVHPGCVCEIIVASASSSAALVSAKWGLVKARSTEVNHWQKFNARKDNLLRVHGDLLARRRCVVVVQGFYEWKVRQQLGAKKYKQPYFVSRKDSKPLIFAGVWDDHMRGEATESAGRTFTVITVAAKPYFQWLHDRMPAILATEEHARAWLYGTVTHGSLVDHLMHQLQPCDEGILRWHPVTPLLNKIDYKGEDAMDPVQLEQLPSVASFFKPLPKGTPLTREEQPMRAVHSTGKESIFRSSGKGRKQSEGSSSASPSKRAKKSPPSRGSLLSFFSPKQ